MTDRKPLQGHFDAKKHAYRQTQDGVVISFVVDPADITPEFAAAPLGTTLKIGYAEYDSATGQAKEPPKEKRRFEDMKPSQQAGILCKDGDFQSFLCRREPRAIEVACEQNEVGVGAHVLAHDAVCELCGVDSLSKLSEQWPEAHWSQLLKEYRGWQMEQRHRNTPAMERGKWNPELVPKLADAIGAVTGLKPENTDD